jgi:hypothetical protein
MRVRHVKKALPRKWAKKGSGIILEADLKIHRYSRLRAKLIVFESKTAMVRNWKAASGHNLKKAAGFVNKLSEHVFSYPGGDKELHTYRCDPRYFCVVGLVKSWLGMEVISHEATHVAYAYQERTRHKWAHADESPEENICYPAGRAARAIVRALQRGGLLE